MASGVSGIRTPASDSRRVIVAIRELQRRTVYAVRFQEAIYVLHALQKKSPSGIRTSPKDIEPFNWRLNEARVDFEARYGEDKR